MYEEAGHEEECRRQHVVRALLHIDLDMSEKAAQQVRGGGGGHAERGQTAKVCVSPPRCSDGMISGADGVIMSRLSLSAGPHAPSHPAQTAAAIFGELEELSVKVVMRKLSRGVVRRGRSSSTKGSVVGAAAGLKTKPRKGEAAGDGER